MSLPQGQSLRKELVSYLPYVEKVPKVADDEQQGPFAPHEQRKPWINLNIIKDWLETCDVHHEGHCVVNDHGASSSPWHGPQWLIDTHERRLVPYNGDMKYFALSYVWGAASGTAYALCLDSSNVKELQEAQFLRNEKDKPKRLPQLIDDVIELVHRLDKCQYLWVDRYCIEQDNGPAKDAQISGMNEIYANAYATIVSADAAAETGIQGIQGQSDARDINDPGNDEQDSEASPDFEATSDIEAA